MGGATVAVVCFSFILTDACADIANVFGRSRRFVKARAQNRKKLSQQVSANTGGSA